MQSSFSSQEMTDHGSPENAPHPSQVEQQDEDGCDREITRLITAP